MNILCPNLIVMAPALAVEPSARDWIPVPKELTPCSVQCVLHGQKSSGPTSEKVLLTGPLTGIKPACRVTHLRSRRQKNRR